MILFDIGQFLLVYNSDIHSPNQEKIAWEMDRRKIREKIVKLKDELKKIHVRREELRRKRHT